MTRLESRVRKLEEELGNTDKTVVRKVVMGGQPSVEIESRKHGQVSIKRLVGVSLDAIDIRGRKRWI